MPFILSITHTKLTRFCLTVSVSSATSEVNQNGHSSPSEDWKHSPDQQWTQAVSRIWLCYNVHQDWTDKMVTSTICVGHSPRAVTNAVFGK